MVTEAVIFDMDGVIFDSEKVICDVWEEYAEKIGLANMHELMIKCIGLNNLATKKLFLETYGDDFPYEDHLRVISGKYHAICDDGRLPLKPGVNNLLSFLKERNIRIAIASSTRIQTVTAQIKAAGIDGYFEKVIGGDMVVKSKPEPDIFLRACEELSVDAKNCFVIEDSYNGVRAAFAAGTRPIMVPDLLPANDEMREKSYTVLKDLNEVRDMLEKIL